MPEGTRAVEVGKLGVLGAGLMGAGIACVAAEAGAAVRMKDASLEALGRGLGQVRGVFEERRKRRSLTSREVGQRMDRVSPSLDLRGFARADLVIEAVFEDLELKRRVLAEVEAVVGEGCVVASNTSSIPIGDIARGCRRPGRVLGMHFFSPVHKMPLLEIVITPETEARGDRHRGGVRAPRGQARDRGPGRPGLLHEPRARRVHERGHARAGGGRRGGRARRRDGPLRLPGGAVRAARRGRHRRRGAGGGRDAAGLRRAHGAARVDGGAAGRRAQGAQGRARLLHLRRREEARRRVRLRAAAVRARRASRSTRPGRSSGSCSRS